MRPFHFNHLDEPLNVRASVCAGDLAVLQRREAHAGEDAIGVVAVQEGPEQQQGGA